MKKNVFAATGAFCLDGQVVVQWTSLTEAAIWGRKPPPGRIRFLFWNSIGSPRLHPDFVLLFEATQAEWNRRCRLACGLSAPGRPEPRWKAVQQTENFNPGGSLYDLSTQSCGLCVGQSFVA